MVKGWRRNDSGNLRNSSVEKGLETISGTAFLIHWTIFTVKKYHVPHITSCHLKLLMRIFLKLIYFYFYVQRKYLVKLSSYKL